VLEECNCGSGKSYIDCCSIIHEDFSKAKHPEELMRSRYCAFTLYKGAYLLETHHASTRKTVRKKELIRWSKSVEWKGLEVLNSSVDSSVGFVEFKAHFISNGKPDMIHEKSKFIFENGRWYYLEGV